MTHSIVIVRDTILHADSALVARLGYAAWGLRGRELRQIDPDLCPCAKVPGLHRLSRGEVFTYFTSHRTATRERIPAVVELHPYMIDGELHVVGRIAYQPDEIKPGWGGGGAGLMRLDAAAAGLAVLAWACRERWPADLVVRVTRAADALDRFVRAMTAPIPDPAFRDAAELVFSWLRREDVDAGSPFTAVLDQFGGMVRAMGRVGNVGGVGR